MLSNVQHNVKFIFAYSLLYILINSFNLLFYIIILNEFISENKPSILKSNSYYFFLSVSILTFIKYGLVLSSILYIKCKSKLRFVTKLILFTVIICINITLLIIIYSIRDKYRIILDNIEYTCYLIISAISIGFDFLLTFIILKNKHIFLNNISYIEM